MIPVIMLTVTKILCCLVLMFLQYCKRPAQPRQGDVCESSFSHCSVTTAPPSRGAAKHHRCDI